MTPDQSQIAGLELALARWNDGGPSVQYAALLHDLIAQAKAAPEPVQGEAVEAVAFLDIGAGGYVDLGTDQAIESLEKMPYGRHMLGIIGTYGADGWQSNAQWPAPNAEPVAYAAFSDNGNIRVWSRELGVIEMMAAQGCKAVPLYTAAAAKPDAELVDLLTECRRYAEKAWPDGVHSYRNIPNSGNLVPRIDAKLAELRK